MAMFDANAEERWFNARVKDLAALWRLLVFPGWGWAPVLSVWFLLFDPGLGAWALPRLVFGAAVIHFTVRPKAFGSEIGLGLLFIRDLLGAASGAMAAVGGPLVSKLNAWAKKGSRSRPEPQAEARPASASFLLMNEPAPAGPERIDRIERLKEFAVDFFGLFTRLLDPRLWLVVGVVILIVFVLRACGGGLDLPFLADTKDELRAERDEARIERKLAEHETRVAGVAVEAAERTHNATARALTIVAEAREDIENAVSQADFDLLYRAYVTGYSGVWDGSVLESEPDPGARRPSGVFAPGSSPV